MRIAFVYDTVYPESKGGVEKRVWELARRLAGRGHDVHLLVPKAWDGPARLEREGVVLRGVCRTRPLYTHRGRRAVWPAVAHAWGVLRFLRRERYDLVDCQIPAHLATLASWFQTRRRPETKLVVTWHEAWDRSWVEEMGVLGHVGRGIESLVATLPAAHLTVSRQTAETLSRWGRDAAAVIPSGVEPPTDQGQPLEAPESDILFVGRMVPTKNLGLLIEATATLVGRGLHPRVLVVGEGPQRREWEEQVSNLGLDEAIEFVGTLETDAQVRAVLDSSKMLALPSVREGFGMIALEAAALGVPVVTVGHQRNAARHLVDHGVTGLCVPPNATDFAEALQSLLEDDELREKLSRGAKESALHATWDAAVDDTEAAYRARMA